MWDLEKAARLSADYRKPSDPSSFEETVRAVSSAIAQHPHLLRPIEYSTNISELSEWCIPNSSFPLADKREIFSVIGHV